MTTKAFLKKVSIGEYFSYEKAEKALAPTYGNDWKKELKEAAQEIDCQIKQKKTTKELKLVEIGFEQEQEQEVNTQTVVQTQNNYNAPVTININIPIMQVYEKQNEETPYGFTCMSRFSFDKITAILSKQKNCEKLIVATISLLTHMSWNNYIPKLNNPKLEEMMNGVWSVKRLKDEKILATLQELDIICINEKKQCMVNPVYGFAVPFSQDNLLALENSYEQFKQTGMFQKAFENNNGKLALA